jgi:mannose-6-phosphate isomerase-like protein (cupin superfamily)
VLKVNTNDIDELTWDSPKGQFKGAGKQVSEALGRKPTSRDLNERHPFDVEILRISPGTTPCPYHSHSAQWEFYHVISGTGAVRHEGGMTPIVAGDAFVFKPGEAHQLHNDGSQDLILYVVADNPIGESHYYPDSRKWGVGSPERRIIRSEPLDYFDGEE